MSFKASSIKLLIGLAGLLSAETSLAIGGGDLGDLYNLPLLASPEEYGNILIDRVSTSNKVKPVTFSHWLHRRNYTCRVCHAELEFAMKVNTTEITEAENRSGKYCGACHNGRIAFRHHGNCNKCHNGNINYSAEKFSEFEAQAFPRSASGYGNGIDWVESQRRGLIDSAMYLKRKSQDNVSFERTFFLSPKGANFISPAVFPHKAHVEWLACSNCHPELFNIKHNSTKNISMTEIAKGNYCGVCHLNVAFPLNDCNGCHPVDKSSKS